jgi:hypothetical protein
MHCDAEFDQHVLVNATMQTHLKEMLNLIYNKPAPHANERVVIDTKIRNHFNALSDNTLLFAALLHDFGVTNIAEFRSMHYAQKVGCLINTLSSAPHDWPASSDEVPMLVKLG